ncbi:MAG: zf-HC2 domain-containing protein [Phycisphaerae bacterium]|nr:zf-HC2 domain-containing protein [Phycisphaerae bacterium]
MIISCKKATGLASVSRDRRLSLGERVRYAVHLALCLPCRRYRAQLGVLGGAARAGDEPAGDEVLREEARERIASSLDQHKAES